MIGLIFAASVVMVGSYHSEHGEAMDEFIIRNARSIEASGLRSNAEVCGSIKRDGDRYTLDIITKGSNIQCSITHGNGETLVHTHLPYMGTRFSPADYSHPGYMIRNGVICYNDGARGAEVTVTKYGRRNGSTCAAQ